MMTGAWPKAAAVTLALILSASLLAGEPAGQLKTDAENSPIGPMNFEFTDGSALIGILINLNDKAYIVRTVDGQETIERAIVREVTPVVGGAKLSGRVPKKAPPKTAAPLNGNGNGNALPAGGVEGQKQPEVPFNNAAVNNGAAKADIGGEQKAEPALPVPEVEDIRIAKTELPVLNDLPEAKPKPRAPRELDPEDNELLKRLRGPDNILAPGANEQPPAREAPGPKRVEQASVERAFTLIEERNYKAAAQAFRALAKSGVADELTKADQVARQKFNRPLQELMVMCYAQVSCAPCKGEGLLKCNTCNGVGYQYRNMATPNPTARTVVQPGARRAIVQCKACRGNGLEVCVTCLGTRMLFPEPTAYEREAFSMYCLKLGAEALVTNESSYGDTAREQTPPMLMPGGGSQSVAVHNAIEQSWLRDSADRVRSDIFRLWRVEGFYRMGLRADPGLPLRYTAKDINQELNKITIRRQMLYGALAERLRFQNDAEE